MTIERTNSSRKIENLPLGAARWTDGFWGDRFLQCCSVMVPTMGQLMTKHERVKFLGNFEVAAGLMEGRHRGPKWNDGDFYKWLEAAATALAFTKDAELDRQVDDIIELIARTQAADGYIHTDVQIAQRAGTDVKRFGDPMDFEMYNMGHLMTAACVHYDATGKRNLLAVAIKAADYLGKEFASPTAAQARHGICPAHLMGLIDLYRTTNDPRYVDLAQRLLKMRDLVTDGDDDNQDRVPLQSETRAVGHAVRGTYLYASATDIYAETGDESLLAPLQEIWNNLVSRKLYITGGCGALFDGASPDGAEDQLIIKRVHQSFGRDYQLPHSTAHNETCAAIGNLLWNWRMFQITGECRFADVVEQTLYNSVLAGVSLDDTEFFYTNTLRQLEPMPVPLRRPRERQKVLSCFCCPPNVAHTVAQSSRYAYGVTSAGIHTIVYGSSRVEATLSDGSNVTLSQETNYPWDGRIRITIDRAPTREFSLSLRIPAWAQNATITINGRADPSQLHAGTFHALRRTWADSDVVELHLPMPVRVVEANPYVEETRNHVAVMRGPIVYCVESTDLPEGVGILDVQLPDQAKLEPGSALVELGNAVAIEGDAIATPRGNWTGQLYRDIATPPQRKGIRVRLIPYYAWGNRGKSEMTVWMPRTH